MTGYDTAGRIQNTYASAHREFGAAPAFWIRYFSPSPAADLFNDDAVAESRGAWDSGGPYVGCVSAPRQSRLSGSAAEGQADAQAFAAAMLAAYHAVRPLQLPSNGHLYCWLDQEYSTSLSPALLGGVGALHSGVQLRGPAHLSAVPVPVLQPPFAPSQLHDHRQSARR